MDEDFRAGINIAGRFVQYQNGWISQKRTGQGKELPLAIGDIACPPFIEKGVIAPPGRVRIKWSAWAALAAS